MVPLPRPHGAPQSSRRILELYAAHLQAPKSTEHALGPRNLDTLRDNASALYIFVGILICLCIAAPVLACLREEQGNNVTRYLWRAKRAAVEGDGRAVELASLPHRHERLEQEQGQYRASQRQHENQLRDEQLRLQTAQQQVRDLEQSMRDREDALTVAQRERDMTQRERDIAQRERDMALGERDTAQEQAREAQQSHAAALETIQDLERERQTHEEGFRSLQQRYNHVDQEYRRLMSEMAGNGV
jgi:hypothetical protein